MQQTDALILSWTKRTATSGWTVRVELPSGTLVDIPVKSEGAVPTGAVLSSVLPELDLLPERFPFTYDMTSISNAGMRTLYLRFLGEKPVYAEITTNTSRFLKANMRSTKWVATEEKVEVSDELTFTQMQSETYPQMFSMQTMSVASSGNLQHEASTEFAKKENKFWLFLDPRTADVIDGDTINAMVSGYGWPNGVPVPKFIGRQETKEYHKKVSVRYLGVDAFELSKSNQQKSNYYGVSSKVLDSAAIEAKHLNQALIDQSNLLAISLQYDKRTDKPVSEYYGRILAVVYATSYNSPEDAAQALREGSFRGININKEMLKPMYSSYQEVLKETPLSIAVPLAEYAGNSYSKEWDGLNISHWGSELHLQEPPTRDTLEEIKNKLTKNQEDTKKIEEMLHAQAIDSGKEAYNFKGTTRKDDTIKGYINNDLSFVPPKDDRIEDGIIYGPTADQKEDLPWDYTHRVRIGDVFLSIPPLSIRMDKQYTTENVSTMRAKSSMQKNIGNVRNILTMDLYFSSTEEINGKEVIGYYNKHNVPVHYYMDGLRPLLAQFKKAPFLPIDNEYINKSLGVENVALRNLQIETIPGFPEAIKATLIVEEFDAKPYLMSQSALGDFINYPLLRWHYQNLLIQPTTYEPWRTYLPPVENFDNRFTFSVINEQQLKERKELIHIFRNKQTPTEFKAQQVDSNTDYGKRNHDLNIISEAMKEFEKFEKECASQTILAKHGLKNKYKGEPYNVPVVIGESWGPDILLNSGEGYSSSETKAGIEIAKHLYGDDPMKNISQKRVSAFAGIISKFGTPADAFFPMRAISSGSAVYHKTGMFMNPRFPGDKKKLILDNKLPGYFQLYLRDPEHQALFSDCYQNGIGVSSTQDGKGKLYVIPAGDIPKENWPYENANMDYLTRLKKLATSQQKKKNDYALKSYEDEYNAIASRINQTEEHMAMDEYIIEDLIPLSLTVSLQNNFSDSQVQTAQSPTMQYFGATDPEIMLSFETTSQGVEDLEVLFRRIGQYVKEYREGIVSGFMGINNPLVALFGINSIMPRNVQYTTVAGHPDRIIVNLTCSAFDKTQRRQEALYGYTGGNSNEQLRDRAYDNYDPEKDSMYVHERMRQMELYPDLELPHVSELNAVLPYINAGLEKWENRTNQVYLDPDFYVSTHLTYRNMLHDVLARDKDIIFRWEDTQGYVADSSLRKEDPLIFIEGSKGEADFQKEAKETPYSDPTLIWKGYSEDEAESATKEKQKNAQEVPVVVETSKPKEDFKDKSVEKYISKSSSLPTFTEWKTWPGNSNKSIKSYEKFKKETKDGPNPAELWHYLAKTTYLSFGRNGKLTVAPEETYLYADDIGGEIDNNFFKLEEAYRLNKELGEVTWMTPHDFYQKSANGVKTTKHRLKNGKKVEELGFFGNLGLMFTSESKVPFQRVLAYVRNLARIESGGKQFVDGRPNYYDKNSKGISTKVGILGAKLTDVKSEQEAQRLAWDWRYNIDTVVKEMAKVFKYGEDSKYAEIFAHRLDWAVASRSWSPLPKILTSNKKEDDTKKSYIGGTINPENDAFYQRFTQEFNRDAKQVYGENVPPLYQDMQYNIIPEVWGYFNNLTKKAKTEEGKQEVIDGVNKTKASIQRNAPIGTQEDRLKGMFVDMYEHDQTGRLLRAFPSFSLQLIDEGKWYNNFRTWDNFYGYNALHAIDVYKSRKIAADTAVVEMSNMYGGLSTKRKDMEYPEINQPSFFSSQFWENYVLGIPTEEQLEARKEIYKTMMLEAGARLHIRMGYGSDARHLPIVFNGVVTEVETGDIVTITAQGDGLELTNAIAGNPDDVNKSAWGNIIEPYNMIGELMTSRGNWVKDMISGATDGKYFKESPLGIAHFGSPIEAPDGTWNIFSSEYGEAMENIYSQNGQGHKSQFMKDNGAEMWKIRQLVSNIFSSDVYNAAGENDEDNIVVKLYGNTPWDIIQTFAMCTHDYTAAVFPTQFRSSLFFGKPHWPIVYDYDTTYSYDEATKKWRRNIDRVYRKTFAQGHLVTSDYNLITNNMKVSSEGVYNNVVVEFDGHVTPPLQADNDIRFDNQRTAYVQANIIARKKGVLKNLLNEATTEAQALTFGHSTVRDFMKDMYKGSYTIIGEPTIKPHDNIYLSDVVQDIQGIHLVKAVHHRMSLETGFISVIEPDANIVNFDAEALFMADKIFTTMKGLNGRILTHTLIAGVSTFGASAVIKKVNKTLTAFARNNSKYFKQFNETVIDKYAMGIIRKTNAYQYQALGLALKEKELLNLGKHLADLSIPVSDEAIGSAKMVLERLAREGSRENIKAIKEAYKATNKTGLPPIRTVANIDEVRARMEAARLAVNNLEEYKKIKNLKGAKLYVAVGKYGDNAAKGFRTVGKIAESIITKGFFWGIILDVALEVITSTLLEKWTRKKQNAECIKVFPLQYKGKPWLAAMNGHRGGVWGDSPGLADTYMHAAFRDGDDSNDSIAFLLPKFINFFAGEDISSKMYDSAREARIENKNQE